MAATHAVAGLFAALVAMRLTATLFLSRAQSLAVARARNEVPQAFAEVLTLAAHHRAADYTRAKEYINRRVAMWDALVLVGWTLGGGLTALDRAVAQWTDSLSLGSALQQYVVSACLLMAGFAACNWLLDLPFALWRTFVIEQRFGFNRTTAKVFAMDQLKGAVLSAVLGLPLWSVVVVCLQQSTAYAWSWAWGVYAAFTLMLVWAGPRLIAPLFNTFRPLTDPSVLARVEGLMQRCGYRHGGLYVMDGSARSTHGNAYFTGLGRAKRVVFFDTLLHQLTGEEVEAVLAHELGHFALGHIQKQLVVSLAVSAAVFYGAAQALGADALYAGLNMGRLTLPGRLIALALMASQLSFWLTPALAWLSRRREYEADAYAAQWARAQALKQALLKLFVDNGATLTPDPWYASFYSSHPPAVQRLGALGGDAATPTQPATAP